MPKLYELHFLKYRILTYHYYYILGSFILRMLCPLLHMNGSLVEQCTGCHR